MSEPALELVYIVRAFSTTTRMLRVDGIDTQPTWAHAEHERVLRAHRAIVLGVALHGEIEDSLLVLVLEQTEDGKGMAGDYLRRFLGNILQVDRDMSSRLQAALMICRGNLWRATYLNPTLLFSSPLHCTFRALEILKLENTCVITRQVFVGIPWARSERAKATIPLEPGPRGHVEWRVNLVGELRVIFFLPVSVSPLLKSERVLTIT